MPACCSEAVFVCCGCMQDRWEGQERERQPSRTFPLHLRIRGKERGMSDRRQLQGHRSRQESVEKGSQWQGPGSPSSERGDPLL